jgi:hypothetical protein
LQPPRSSLFAAQPKEISISAGWSTHRQSNIISRSAHADHAITGTQWADVTTLQSAGNVHERWILWWKSQGNNIEIHGMADCESPESLD